MCVNILRYVSVLFLFSLLSTFAPSASAQNNCGNAQNNCDEGEANAVCKAALEWTKTYRQTVQNRTPVVRSACTHPSGSVNPGYFFCDVGSNPGSSSGCLQANTTTQQNSFYHQKLCTDRPPAGTGQTREWTSRCVGGCLLEVKYGESVTFSIGAESFTEAYGDLVYTGLCPGNTPNTPDDAGPDKTEECKPIAGMSMCLKGNGDQCLVASSGKKFCWTPGQPSNEVNGNDAVATDPTAPPPPNQPPADGTGWKPPQTPTPTTSATGGSSGPRTTIVNVTTSVGTGSNGGGGDPPGGDDGDCDPATETCPDAGGGQTCGAAPSCTGDPINCQVLFQAWKTRCAVEGTPVAGGVCGGPSPACTGSNVLCAIAERERQHKCDVFKQQTDYAASLASEAAGEDGLDGIEISDIYSDGSEFASQLNPGLLGGSNGGTCATSFTIGGQQFNLPPQFWSLAAWINILLVALAYIWAAQMVIR